ncbi:Uu.00g024310.m01.CDS01 [Anthostomella pinea]|uniref:Uu.00g024310.m01.CDS01 n=1 Tax=Anthostomella pinea TaxID=933095 RepID=A0AAI8YP15_9PEZI|nr:Uu.00g024310.m01.CDS01 [Anthostomella pinea]
MLYTQLQITGHCKSRSHPKGDEEWLNRDTQYQMTNYQSSKDSDLFKIINWHKLGPDIKSPPLKVGNLTVEDTTGKAYALKTALLDRRSAEDDLVHDPLEFPIAPRAALE